MRVNKLIKNSLCAEPKKRKRKPDPRRKKFDDDSCDFEGKPLGYIYR
jgi:hypothetical protein